MSNSVTSDENCARTTIDAMVDIKSVGFVPDTVDESITVCGANEIFAIIGKPYDVGGQEYAAITAGEYGSTDLDGMMKWLSENNPGLFSDLLLAVLSHADEDDLDDALVLSGWADDPDILIEIDYDWLVEALDEDSFTEFLCDLREALAAYLEENSYEDLTFSIEPFEWEECGCSHCTCPFEVEDDDDDCKPYEIDVDAGLGDQDTAKLECAIDLQVIRPLLEKYGIAETDDPPAE